ncbi:acyltransferase [Neorhizobium galegae]|uniref:acyltransferase family protein n=1 Tax=Neorhizobium galegae TaxID=399 RepID=UPI000621AAE4|nr:acyltransferase [Neorhizobium galegae]CDZ29266.1 Acyltransferase 3 [Neorhizobium galegae bv. officinalis]MCM2500047.1 acyltransferase [Neorhizobium galegae]MCQ1771393.1 acyltransferase [Neorhizobium galegae]MCQ1778413.1 acyltransferase [Neorhizobium galegae]MCQ1798672.1 acyltransferase [Neorhizobium galegae]
MMQSRPHEETGKHLDYLDGWRGIAVICVIVGHFWLDDFWPGASTFGVDLFFVLSGRLMSEILFVRRAELPTFFFRRFSRIYPALFAFVVITTLAFQGTGISHGPVAAVLALTFTLNYAMVYTHPVALLDHLWSLCVEEHAYILLAGIAFLSRRWLLPVAALIIALGTAAMLNGIIRTELGASVLYTHWRSDVSVAGIFIAGGLWLFLRNRQAPWWVSPLALLIAVAAKGMPFQVLSFGLSTAMLALSITTIDSAAPVFRKLLSTKVLTYAGLWSFSLYLWQQPFYKLYREGAAPTPVLLLAALATALASFYLVEKPSRKALNRLFEGRAAKLAAIERIA